MILRPYQIDLVNKARALMQAGHHSILIQSPTGSGKTALTAHMLHTSAGKGLRSFFIVHRKELIDQSVRAFNLEGLKHGIIAAGFPQNRSAQVQIAGIATLARRLQRYRAPSLIIWDECHHLGAKTWGDIYRTFPDAYHIGLTATPERLDGQGLGKYFTHMISGPSVTDLTTQGYLSPYKLYAPSHVNLDGVRRQMGDYVRGELSIAIDKPKITGSAVEHYKKHALGKRAIVFAVSIEHSKHIVEEFQKEGFHARHVDGETASEEREAAIKDFSSGTIQVLSNVELFGEGFDVPAMECAILLRPTQSLGLYLQQVGRSLRPHAGKTHAIILDHVGNCERFGLPDQIRDWSLEGRDKSKGEYQASVRICESCFGAQPMGKTSCIFCGAVFSLKPRTVETVVGTLKEIDQTQLALKLKWKREQGMSKGFKELVALGKARGYKRAEAWAMMVLKGRQAKKLKEVA